MCPPKFRKVDVSCLESGWNNTKIHKIQQQLLFVCVCELELEKTGNSYQTFAWKDVVQSHMQNFLQKKTVKSAHIWLDLRINVCPIKYFTHLKNQ